MINKIKQIIVLRETREREGRVALTPSKVQLLAAKNYIILVESNAGKLAGFSDDEYIHAGGKIFRLNDDKIPPQSLILRVKRPIKGREELENALFSKNTLMMGFLDPFDVENENHISRWESLGLTLISLELLKFAADDPRDAQAAMSRFAGKLALKDALARYKGILPKKVTIIGTGPAGMSAASFAKSLGLSVQMFGRQEKYREKIESNDIQYYVLPPIDQVTFLRKYLSDQTIIITAVRSIGKAPPILIDKMTIAQLPDNTVIADLTAGEGGCVVGIKEEAVIQEERGILIVNVSGYPKAEPREASEAFASCIVNLVTDIMTPDGKVHLDKLSSVVKENHFI